MTDNYEKLHKLGYRIIYNYRAQMKDNHSRFQQLERDMSLLVDNFDPQGVRFYNALFYHVNMVLGEYEKERKDVKKYRRELEQLRE